MFMLTSVLISATELRMDTHQSTIMNSGSSFYALLEGRGAKISKVYIVCTFIDVYVLHYEGQKESKLDQQLHRRIRSRETCDDERNEQKAKETERELETERRQEGKANGKGHEEEKDQEIQQNAMRIVQWAWRLS